VGEREIPFTGLVAWAKAGDARMNLRGRFGVRFDTAIPELVDRSAPPPSGIRPAS
jgi:hypothetical protein